MGNDDPQSEAMLARAEWAKKQDALIEDAAQRIVDLMAEDFAYLTENNNLTRIRADVVAGETADLIIAEITANVATKWTQWIVDNKVHF